MLLEDAIILANVYLFKNPCIPFAGILTADLTFAYDKLKSLDTPERKFNQLNIIHDILWTFFINQLNVIVLFFFFGLFVYYIL